MIGGNGSLSIACELHADEGLPIVGVPKTIDNDIVGTDVTFGFNTAVQIATDAIDRLHTTAESHDRVMVVEVMGRHSGWIAAYAGIAGGAAAVLIPEIPFDIDEVCARIRRRHERGRFASIIVVAEGAEPVPGTLDVGERLYDQFGHVRLGGIGSLIAETIGERTGFDTRVVHARPRPARRHADRVRPGAVDTVRDRRDRPRARARRGVRWWCRGAARSCPPHSSSPSAGRGPSTWRCTATSRCSSRRGYAVLPDGIGGYGGWADSARPGIVVDRERPLLQLAAAVGPVAGPSVDADRARPALRRARLPVNTIWATASRKDDPGSSRISPERSTLRVLATRRAECRVDDEGSGEVIPLSASPGFGPAMSVLSTASGSVGGSTSRSTVRSSRSPPRPSPATR